MQTAMMARYRVGEKIPDLRDWCGVPTIVEKEDGSSKARVVDSRAATLPCVTRDRVVSKAAALELQLVLAEIMEQAARPEQICDARNLEVASVVNCQFCDRPEMIGQQVRRHTGGCVW